MVLLAVVLVIGLVVMFTGVFQMLRGAAGTPHQASGPYATATTSDSSTTTDTALGTPVPGATPPPTTSASAQTGAVRVTQNQDMRPACVDNTAPYTVMLFNGGHVTANWHVNIPTSPVDTYPYWATANPQDGSVAPGQTANFVMTLVWHMPCGGTVYHASVQLSFPAGTTQADIPLTYAGTGPAPNSNVVLVSGNLNTTEACPASGVAPTPYTIAFKNMGNGIATLEMDTSKERVGANYWANIQVTRDPEGVNPNLFYPGQTWTITIVPQAGVLCDGTVYHAYVLITDTQGKQTTMTFTDVFQ